MGTQMENEEKGNFCFLANVKTFLSNFDMQQEEYWLGGMLGVMGFYFTTLKTGIPSVVNGRSDEFEGLYAHFVEYLKEPLVTERFTGKEEALARAGALLRAGMVPMMWMDEYYLPLAYNYGKNHLWVMAVIQKETEAGFEIFNNEKRIMPKEKSEELIFRDGVIEIQYAPSRPGWKYTEKEMAVKGLRQVVDNLRKTSSLEEQYFGIEGMREYKKVFEACRDFNVVYDYFYEMNRGGGLYKTRRNMHLFLQELEKRWPSRQGQACTSLYADLEEKWTKITNLTFKLSISKDPGLQQRIGKRLEEAILLEERGTKQMEELMKALI